MDDSGISYGDGDLVTIDVRGQSVTIDFADTVGGVNGPAAGAIISDVRLVLAKVADHMHRLERLLMAPRC